MKYISLQDLIDYGKELRFQSEEQMAKVYEELPSIEIVRCKDCRHRSPRNGGHCEIWDWYISNDAFYCGCGERKEDG